MQAAAARGTLPLHALARRIVARAVPAMMGVLCVGIGENGYVVCENDYAAHCTMALQATHAW